MPFVCGATNIGEALRRIGEGASMIRTKGEAGTGDIVQAVTHMRTMTKQIKEIQSASEAVSYTHLTLPTTVQGCRSRWSPYH